MARMTGMTRDSRNDQNFLTQGLVFVDEIAVDESPTKSENSSLWCPAVP